ncbi:MAG: xylulokinase [Puniceicoccaceae bacterium]
MSEYFIGIDVGTSSAKVVVIDAAGEVIQVQSPTYAFRTPKPLWAESDPTDWWEACLGALREVVEQHGAEAIQGIGLTGQMHGLVLLDAEGEVLRPCIMWNDQRTGEQCETLTRKVGAAEVLELTGNPILPGFTAPKITWVQEKEPEVWAKVAKILLPKDYLRYRLSGSFATDVSDASGMSLLNVGKRQWSERMLQACGVSKDMLPEVTESTVASASVSAEAARLTGLLEGTPIIAGGGDQAAGAVGCGIVRTGVVSATLGTSGVVFAHADSYQPDPQGRLHTFCSAVPGKWHFMGVQLSCAGSYQWFHEKVAQGLSFKDLDKLAGGVKAGSEGLLFLPYLSGERTPHPDPHAKGVFFGLTLRHGLEHMARSVMEGVTFGLRDALEIMQDLGIQPQQIVASGGGAKSPLWRQILADNFKARIVTVNASEGGAYGAAVLASVGVGAYGDVESACDAMLKETGTTDPGADQAAYDTFYPVYRKLYPDLKESFGTVSSLVGAE